MAKHTNDVRALSADHRYLGVVFEGSLADAIAQARAAPDHGPAEQYVPAGMSRSRAALLQHLNLLNERDGGFVAHAGRKPPKRAPSPYSLEYALSRWPHNFRRSEPILPPNWGLPS